MPVYSPAITLAGYSFNFWIFSLNSKYERIILHETRVHLHCVESMAFEETTEYQLIQQLLESLRAIPEVQATLDEEPSMRRVADREYDARVDVRVSGRRLTLLIEAKKSLYPRDVRQALWQIRETKRRDPEDGRHMDTVPMLIAESISPGSKELLQGERVGYFDSGGSLFLPAEGAYLLVDKPPPKVLVRAARLLFSGRRARVLHALLIRHADWTGVKALAEQTQVSPATVSQVLRELERLEWLESRGQGPVKERHLREPAALLDAWGKYLATTRPIPLRRFYVSAVRSDALVDKIAQAFGERATDYAITDEAAAQRYAPFLSTVSQVRCRVVPGRATDEALDTIGSRAVNEGANLTVIDAKSPGELLFREKVDGAWLASPVQVYLDLLQGEGRAKDMAEHLRREKIGF